MIGTLNWIEPCDTTAVVTQEKNVHIQKKKKKSNQIKKEMSGKKSGDQNVQKKPTQISRHTQNTDKKMKEGGLWL